MTLNDFKFIFYMEYAHRLWGRATGTFFLLPAVGFLAKGWITKAMRPRLALYTALLGFQVCVKLEIVFPLCVIAMLLS